MAKIKTIRDFDPAAPDNLTTDWADGVTTTWDLSLIDNEEIRARALWHGISQKTSDKHSGGIGAYGSVAGCREQAEQVFERLCDGFWFKTRAARGRQLWSDLAAVFDVTPEEAEKVYTEASEETQKALSRHPGVEALRAERALERAKARSGEETTDLAKLFK